MEISSIEVDILFLWHILFIQLNVAEIILFPSQNV